jgi:hypothetical protein
MLGRVTSSRRRRVDALGTLRVVSSSESFLQVDAHSDPYGNDIYDEPDGAPDTLVHLGPLAPLAGVWVGMKGYDAHPHESGRENNVFVENSELQPIDRQTNGPQLFYGLRYHTHVVKKGETETFHDQVG